MKRRVILALDQGTTGTRAILYDQNASSVASAYQEFTQYYPRPGWVEHDPLEIWQSTLNVIKQALQKSKLSSSQIIAIGITNQRETTLLWDRKTGRPIHRALVWQDRRTAPLTEKFKKQGLEKKIHAKTGLVLDPYFSASKIHWMLEHIPGLRKKAQSGQILFGTMDTWLLWKLTGGRSHATDYTNASRTLLFNIKTKKWDEELLKYFSVPKTILPQTQASGSQFGSTVKQGPLQAGIPILAIMGDQQAALYGQACYKKGEAKNTYGTGCFIMMNLGSQVHRVPKGLLLTLACDIQGKPVYALEGSIFIAGAAIQWLRDGLQFFKQAKESESLARSVSDSGGVTVIPALAGLAAPYWNPHVRGMITGLTRGTTRAHIVRATLESLAQQTADVMECMEQFAGGAVRQLKVDGGATHNQFLMQFQADLLGLPVLVSDLPESTAWGVGKLAAKIADFWPSLKAIDSRRKYRLFKPRMKFSLRHKFRKIWKHEIQRLLFSL